MNMKVTILGTSGVYPTIERACSGYLVEFGATKLWLDAGPGTWRNLLKYTDYASLSGILLTHRHPDHTTDAFMAYHARFWGEPEPLPPIPLWAPAETIERIYGFNSDSTEGFDLHEIDEDSAIEIEDARLTFTKMAHPPETLGVRVERAGAVLAYTADSGDQADFHRLAHGANILLSEATFQDSDSLWEGHLRASQAGEIAAKVEARRLILTHLPPGRDYDVSVAEARGTYGSNEVVAAHDGMILDVSS